MGSSRVWEGGSATGVEVEVVSGSWGCGWGWGFAGFSLLFFDSNFQNAKIEFKFFALI